MEIVHCINLDKREDRLLSVAKEAKQQGFALMLWDGIDAVRKDTKKAICQSHKKIIEYARNNQLPYVIIAEDDLFFYGEGAFKYYMDNRPERYDLYFGCVYQGEVNEEDRVMNGMSGVMTLYTVPEHMYDWILREIPNDCHIDRELGNFCHKFKFIVSPLIVCGQRGGYSDNLKTKTTGYEVYLKDRKVFGRDQL